MVSLPDYPGISHKQKNNLTLVIISKYGIIEEYRQLREKAMVNEKRWQQRFANYKNALAQLESAVKLAKQRDLSDLEKQGIIQTFEFTHELAWNVMKDYFSYQGNPNITGSRDAIRESFNKGIIAEGEGWMEMIRSRNQTSHTYNHKIANEIVEKILNQYFPLFETFSLRMQERVEH